jgi:hypothetical protein
MLSAITAAFLWTGFTTFPDRMQRVHTLILFSMPVLLTVRTF